MSKFVWTQQPQVPVEIDWNNPLTRGLAAVVLNIRGHCIELLTQQRFVRQSMLISKPQSFVGNKGDIGYFSAGATLAKATPADLITGVWSAFAETVPTGDTSVGNYTQDLILVSGDEVNMYGFGFGTDQYDAINNVCALQNATTGSTARSSYIGAGVNAYSHRVGVVYTGSEFRFFRNGKYISSTAYTTNPTSHVNRRLNLSRRPVYGNTTQNGIGIVLVWNRVVSDLENNYINSNPWQIFKPQNRPTFTDLPSYYETVGSIQRTYHTRTSQPQVPVGISDLGVSRAWALACGGDIILDSTGYANGIKGSGAQWSASPDGLELLISSASSGSGIRIGNSSGSAAPPNLALWSFEANVYLPSFNSSNPIIGTNSHYGLCIRINSTGKIEVLRQAAVMMGASTAALSTNRRHKIAVTYKNPSILFYIDGVPAGSASSNWTFVASQYTIGGAFSTGEFVPAGTRIGRVVFSNRILSDADISNRANVPWQIFAPDARTMLSQFTYNPPVGGGDTSYPLSIGDATAQGVNTALDYDFYTANVADAAATGVNAFIGSTIDCSVADASAEGIIYNLDKYIDLSVADAAAEGTAYYSDYSIPTSIADASAQGINLYQDIDNALSVGNANAEGITYNLDKSIDLSVGDAAAEGVAYAGGSSIDCGVGDASAAGTPYYNDYFVYCGVANSDAQGITLSSDISLVLSMANAAATGESLLQDRNIPLSVANASAEGTAYIPDYGINCQVADAAASGQPIQNQIDMYCQTANASAEGITCSIGLTAMEYDPAYKYVFSPSGKYFTLLPISRNNTLTSGNRVQVQASGNRSYTFVVPKPQTNFIRN